MALVLVLPVGGLAGSGCDPARGRGIDARAATTRAAPTAVPAATAGVVADGGADVPEAAADGASQDTGSSQPPLTASEPIVELPLDGYDPAVVSLPVGTVAPRPVVVVTHGNYDRPEWQCREWRRIVENRGFVLCPRGRARPDSPSRDDTRYSYPNNAWLEKEIGVALRALDAKYGDYLAPGRVMYAGFSQGAIMGVAIAARDPARWGPLVLVEGGYGRWTPARVKAYASAPGQRVLFVCGQKGCDLAARSAAARLDKAGVAARHALVSGQGHSYGGPLSEPIRQAWEWLVAGDDRWGDAAP